VCLYSTDLKKYDWFKYAAVSPPGSSANPALSCAQLKTAGFPSGYYYVGVSYTYCEMDLNRGKSVGFSIEWGGTRCKLGRKLRMNDSG
jgi:hypothetical protein